MKIIILVGSFKLGGTEKVAAIVGKELLKKHDVKFILIHDIFDYADDVLKQRSHCLWTKTKKTYLRPLKFVIIYFRLMREIYSFKPDKLISFSKGLNILAALTFFRDITFTIESNIFIYTKKLYRRYIQKYLALLPNVKTIVVPSPGLHQKCTEYFFNSRKLVQVSNPVEVSVKENGGVIENKEMPIMPFIVSAGRLVKSKRFDQLIDYYAQSELCNELQLIILGEGPERSNLQNKIDKAGLSDKVILTGFVPEPNVYFRKAQFFMLSSFHESFGNVIIEAMSCGLPVISYDCDFGPRDIIDHGVNGYLYNDETGADAISYMRNLFHDFDLRNFMSAKAREAAEKYDISKVIKSWDEKVINK